MTNTAEHLGARTLTIEQAAAVLGVGRSVAYRAARSGELPTIRLGKRLLVPRQKLAAMLGETNENSDPAGNRIAVQTADGDGHGKSYPD
jgi:excisionase family DNA binding protein